jgi:hypothetical protein
MHVGMEINTRRVGVGSIGLEARVADTVSAMPPTWRRVWGITREYGAAMLVGEVDSAALNERIIPAGAPVAPQAGMGQGRTAIVYLLKIAPGAKLYEAYNERIGYYRNNPPGTNRDGVFVCKTK